MLHQSVSPLLILSVLLARRVNLATILVVTTTQQQTQRVGFQTTTDARILPVHCVMPTSIVSKVFDIPVGMIRLALPVALVSKTAVVVPGSTTMEVHVCRVSGMPIVLRAS